MAAPSDAGSIRPCFGTPDKENPRLWETGFANENPVISIPELGGRCISNGGRLSVMSLGLVAPPGGSGSREDDSGSSWVVFAPSMFSFLLQNQIFVVQKAGDVVKPEGCVEERLKTHGRLTTAGANP